MQVTQLFSYSATQSSSQSDPQSIRISVTHITHSVGEAKSSIFNVITKHLLLYCSVTTKGNGCWSLLQGCLCWHGAWGCMLIVVKVNAGEDTHASSYRSQHEGGRVCCSCRCQRRQCKERKKNLAVTKGGGCRRRQKHAVVVLASTWMDAWIDADLGVVISAMG